MFLSPSPSLFLMSLCSLTSIQFSQLFLGLSPSYPRLLAKSWAAFLRSHSVHDYHFPQAIAAYNFITFCHRITNYIYTAPHLPYLVLVLAVSQAPIEYLCFAVTFSTAASSPLPRLQRGLQILASLSSFLKAPHHFFCPFHTKALFGIRSLLPPTIQIWGGNTDLESSPCVLLVCKR